MKTRTQPQFNSAIVNNASALIDFIEQTPELALDALIQAKNEYNNSYNFFKHRASSALSPLMDELIYCIGMTDKTPKAIALSNFMKNFSTFLGNGTWWNKSANTLVINNLLRAWNDLTKQFSAEDQLSLAEIQHQGSWLKDGLMDRSIQISDRASRMNEVVSSTKNRTLTKVSNKKIEEFLTAEINTKLKSHADKPVQRFSAEMRKFHSKLLDNIIKKPVDHTAGENKIVDCDTDAVRSYQVPEIHKLNETKKETYATIENLLRSRLVAREEKDKLLLKQAAIEKPIAQPLANIREKFAEVEKTLALKFVQRLPTIIKGREEDKKRKKEEFKEQGFKRRITGFSKNSIKPDYLDALALQEEKFEKQKMQEAEDSILVGIALLFEKENADNAEERCVDSPVSSASVAEIFAQTRVDSRVFAGIAQAPISAEFKKIEHINLTKKTWA